MLPVIALVGRPNVGKSTLFNYLTRSRDALVADLPGLTRDRRYGFGRVGPAPYIVVDTGGLGGETRGLEGLMARQTLRALDESDLVFFIVDAREGVTAADEEVAALLRSRGAETRLIVNKAEGLEPGMAAADFFNRSIRYYLGIKDGNLSEALPHDPGRKLVLNRLYLRQLRHFLRSLYRDRLIDILPVDGLQQRL